MKGRLLKKSGSGGILAKSGVKVFDLYPPALG